MVMKMVKMMMVMGPNDDSNGDVDDGDVDDGDDAVDTT